MTDITFIVPLVLATLVSLAMFGLTTTNRDAKGAYVLMGLFGSIAIWSGAYAVQLSVNNLQSAILWNNIRFFGISVAPVVTLVFALEYTGRDDLVTRRNLALLFVVPVLTNVIIWTNPMYNLWGVYTYVPESETLVQLTTTWGPWFLVHTIYSFLAGLSAVGLFAAQWVTSEQEGLVNQTTAFLFATLLPILGSLVTVVGLAPLDLAPFAFTITGVLLVVAIFKL